jgi:hypothetical protein
MIDTPNLSLKMRVRIITRHGFDTSLKLRTILPQIMPQSSYLGPIFTAKIACVFLRTLSHAAQVLI